MNVGGQNRALTAALIILSLAAGFIAGTNVPKQAAEASAPPTLTTFERGQLMAQCYAIQERDTPLVPVASQNGGPAGARPGAATHCLDAIANLP